MNPLVFLLATSSLLTSFTVAWAAPTSLKLHTASGEGQPLSLVTKDARQQLLVTAVGDDGSEKDVTRSVQWSVDPIGAVQVTKTGVITPKLNGVAKLMVTWPEAPSLSVSTSVEVSKVEAAHPIHFAQDVVPVLTKYGCNGGGCHGKVEGQNHFKLSLLGFEPAEDYEHLVWESRGRRLFPAAPENSLLLLKGTGELPHGGGGRMERGTADYEMLVRWMEQGMPVGEATAPKPVSLVVFPSERVLAPESDQQLQVTAVLSDGSRRDVTALCVYESNAKDMAEVNKTGLVHTARQTGDAAIMVRFQELASVFRATIPLGAPTNSLPLASNLVDEHVFAKLRQLGLPASALADEATFLRRVTLDIAGRLPRASEAKAYLADQAPDKRIKLIDRLLASGDYADYFANKWAALLRNRRPGFSAADPLSGAHGTTAFHEWIRQSLFENKPFSDFVSEILTASGDISSNPPVAWYRAVTKTQEQLQDVSQLFCGQRLQCAQCHHHPYEKWSQQDYFGFAAFFTTVGRKRGTEPMEEIVFHQWKEALSENPKTKKPVKPTPLGAPTLSLRPQDDPRAALAEWMTTKENPFFAKMLVNRYWKHFFGRALVEPEDDMRATNPPTNPALIEALAKRFAESNFDLKALIRTLCSSTTYQLSSLPNEFNGADRQNHSRFYPRRLQAEVLLDAIDGVTGMPTKFGGQPLGTKATQLPDDSFNASSYFLTVFGRPDNASACECERASDGSLAQALHLLNAKNIQEKITHEKGWAAKLTADYMKPPAERVEELYLTALSRPPTADETTQALSYLARKGESKQAFEDLIWAVINTKEFLFNH